MMHHTERVSYWEVNDKTCYVRCKISFKTNIVTNTCTVEGTSSVS